MEHIPFYIPFLFIATTVATIYLFVKAGRFNKTLLAAIITWCAIQAIIAAKGFYSNTHTMPPRLLFALLPPLLMIALLLFTGKGKQLTAQMKIADLTFLHIIRIPVEIVLLLLATHKAIPSIMTFEGTNPDIMSGSTAPVIWYAGFIKKRISIKFLLWWNIICLLLLGNIVITAVLCTPFPIQQLAFDQPNIAVLYFPYVWLPAVVVPIVLLTHLLSIRKLWALQQEGKSSSPVIVLP